MRILESNRIIIKPVEQEDLPFLLCLRWDSDIVNYLIHEPISSKSQQTWFESIAKSNDIPFSIFVKEPDNAHKTTIAGTVGLYNFKYRHQRATWRLRISSDFQGKGIGFEATNMVLDYGFNTLNLHKIDGDAFAENIAILKLAKKLGFVEEGVLRSHYFHQGCFRNSINLGLLKEDFNRNHNK
jgi:RimJ/RimL family protein N-acetyltransferase